MTFANMTQERMTPILECQKVRCWLVGCLALCFFFSGCDSARDENKITLRVIGEGYPPLLAFEQVKEDFEEKFGITVEITKRDHMAVVAEIDREAASGIASYDLVVMPHRLLGRLVEQDYVQPIDSFLSDPMLHDSSVVDPEQDFFPGWWSEISWYRDRPYGYPFMALTMYLWYRKDLFEDVELGRQFQRTYGRQLAPPSTWPEYREVAEFFHRPSQRLYGTTLQGQRHVALWYEWLSYAVGFGGGIMAGKKGEPYGEVVIDSSENLRATEFYQHMLNFSSPEAANHNWDDALASFQQGRVAVGIMWHDSAPWVEDPEASKVAGLIGYAPPPSLPGGAPRIQLEGHTFLIPRRAEHPREAFKLMEWAMSHEAQVKQALLGGMSPRLSVYEEENVSALPYMRAFLEIVRVADAIPKPKFPEAQAVTEVMTRDLSRMTSGEEPDVSVLLHQMQRNVEHLLKSTTAVPRAQQ